MLITIDIGNSYIHLALFDKDKIINPKIIPHNEILILPKENVTGAIIASVVPDKNELFYKMIKSKYGIEPKFISAEILNGSYKELGADRVANIFGGIEILSSPVCVVDFGTATTIDVFTNEYIGGVILPGVSLGIEFLHSKTAMLPRIELKEETKLLGKSTYECIGSGIYFGEIYRIKGFINEIKTQIPDIKIISTGGFGKFFYKYLDIPYEEWLTLLGLNYIWKKGLI